MIGEDTFRRYWLGDSETVEWIDRDADDLMFLLSRKNWSRRVVAEGL